jgi:hypothetical protein
VDELLEEERVFRDQFYTQNMELKIIKKIEQSKEDGAAYAYEVPSIQGEPYYQAFKNFDLWLKFNS